MKTANCRQRLVSSNAISAIATMLVLAAGGARLEGQTNVNTGVQRAVGGVSINAGGLLENAQPDALGQLAKLRAEALGKAPEGMKAMAGLRKISLSGLEAAIAECAKNKQPLPDEISYLGGLQGIRYVFVYPEEKDIVLAGPAEGWKVDKQGNVVGVTTGRPVMLLDDLLVALRSARQAAQGGISCSIDPTPEGMAKLNQYTAGVKQIVNAEAEKKTREELLGMQQITVAGVPGSTHFARVLVAADYRMKRIGMGFEPAPANVKLPSYLQMLSANSRSVSTPRWWMEPKYDALLKDAAGLAWELRSAGVQTRTEEDHFSAEGGRQHSGKANPLAKKWADLMTDQYAALAAAEPVFGELRNCMDLAVVAALLVKERLPEKAGASLPLLFTSSEVKPEEYYVPKQVASQASLLHQSKGWVVSVSGGVTIDSWSIAGKSEENAAVAAVREKAAAKSHQTWWWN